ncbi:hypothetical protein QUA13_22665 [Microcoleus sp. S28C3]|uniref:hypothetical protein n=1 Tax=Microcoleus sp. S28C3 TaxID=3055414 RepID=UPI002FD51F49
MPQGFKNYGQIQEWITQECQVVVSEKSVDKILLYKLNAKMKVPRTTLNNLFTILNEVSSLALNKCLTSRPIAVAFRTLSSDRGLLSERLCKWRSHQLNWSLLRATS